VRKVWPFGLVLAVCFCIAAYLVGRGRPVTGCFVHSQYQAGVLSFRAVLPTASALGPNDSVLEVTEEGGPILRGLLRVVLLADVDGVHVKCPARNGLTSEAYVTHDDLRAAGGYEATGFGAKQAVIEQLTRELLVNPPPNLRACAFRRARYRAVANTTSVAARTPLSVENARASVRDGAVYLVRNMRADGRFAYSIDGRTGVLSEDYNWPRHAGTEGFLARAGRELAEPALVQAALRAEAYMRKEAVRSCAGDPCVADGNIAYLGSTALALIALTELVRAGETQLVPDVASFARTVRKAQRADGEFMHVFRLDSGAAEDTQLPYFSGEAVYALTLAYEITNAPEDLDAAVRGLRYLVGPAWDFFGSAYYRAEEHWTCQAMAQLWRHRKNEEALRFCLSWFDVQASLLRPSGGFSPVAIIAPRLTPTASKSEATLAIASVLRQERQSTARIDAQLSSSLQLLLDAQFRPGPKHLFADPEQMHGGMPGGLGDLTVRIDYLQHAESAMLAYVSYMGAPPEKDQ
jgi:hypothetical protein